MFQYDADIPTCIEDDSEDEEESRKRCLSTSDSEEEIPTKITRKVRKTNCQILVTSMCKMKKKILQYIENYLGIRCHKVKMTLKKLH